MEHEAGDEWDRNDKSYQSYDIVYQPQDMPFNGGRPEVHPVEVKVGMGINLQPPASSNPRRLLVDGL